MQRSKPFAVRLSPRHQPTRWAMGGVGLIATAALHGLLLGALLYGGAAQRSTTPHRLGAGASAQLAGGEPVMTLIFIDQSVFERSADEYRPELLSEGLKPEDMLADVASPETLPPSSIAPDPEAEMDTPVREAQGEAATRAALFGRYMGQIQARIERAWYRPRSAIGAERFRCQVLIHQNARGEVQSIELPACNGDARWQLSLAQAIQSASPLPAPPDPAVFVGSLTLEFESPPFIDGGPAWGFEPEPVAVAMTP